ncbi:proton channel OtopLc-like [Dendronephthya gigantea]|uniref:proton channel OtopLc-like n=1 Tax=Dendronephthya gigantea TaxID=151771 RepID=UPI00106D1718|nr:proton channel OtopLc-like [Dendronephthya gigantea]
MPSKDRGTKGKFSLSYCSSCFYSIFQPFSPSNSRRDGNTLSLLYLICLTTIGVVLNISRWLQKDRFSKTNIVTHDHISGFLMTCILPSLIWMLYYTVKTPGKSTVEFLNSSVYYQDPFISGVYFFGTGSIFLHILQIAFYIEAKTEIIRLLFTVLNTLFIVTQIIFLRKYSKASYQDDSMIRMALLHLLSTNIILFCHMLMSQSHHSAVKSIDHNGKTLRIGKVLNHVYPFLYPFLIEFPLSSLGAIYRLWSDLKELEPKPDDIYIDDELTEINTMDSVILAPGEKFLNPERDIRKPSSPMSPFQSPRIRKSTSNIIIQQSKCDIMRRCVGLGLLFGVIFSVFFLTVVGVTTMHTSATTVRIFFMTNMAYLTFTCISCWIILKGLLSQMYCWFDYGAVDVMLLLALIAVLFHQGFIFTASIAQIYISILPCYMLTLSVMEIIQCMLQTSTVIRALRFRIGYRSSLVREASLFLMICNIIIWLQRSFLVPQTPFLSLVQSNFYGKASWDVVFLLTYPFQAFFRFHSTICLYNIWCVFNE